MKNIHIVILLFSPLFLLADTHYVDINSTNPVSPYTNWFTAGTNIQDAVDIATDGDTVLVTNGIYNSGTRVTPSYSSLNRLVITNDITVKSVNGPSVTIIAGSASTGGGNGVNAVRGVYMNAGILSGFTITNGHTMSSNNYKYDQSGGGVNMYGGNGVVSNCILIGNAATYWGGGSSYGTLNNCTLTGNTANHSGGGSFYGTLNNCTLTGNTASYGGGSYQGTLNNCTLTGNTAHFDGGGSYYATLNNCIVYYNEASAFDNWHNGELNYCCTVPMPSGAGNITKSPMLLSVSHIHPTSPCASTGSTNYSSGIDIDGDSWGLTPSIGCDEPLGPFVGALNVAIFADYTNTVAVGYELILSANIVGQTASNHWTFGDSSLFDNSLNVEHAWMNTGTYEIVVTAYNDDNLGGIHATMKVSVVSDRMHYVDINNPNPVPPYTSWSTAATNIQDAVNEACQVPGNTVLVSNGVYNTGTTVTPGYSCLNRVVITNDITVKSVNGPEVTYIVGAEATDGGNGSNAVRGVYMNTGKLSGFTITNGHTMIDGDWYFDMSGGGINMFGGNGVVTNCFLIGNSALEGGGGSYYGTLNNCIITNNIASIDGGGSSYGTLNNCIITDNSADTGGGNYQGILNNCKLTRNTAYYGGGVNNSILNNCILSKNNASEGGGAINGILNNCLLIGNTAYSTNYSGLDNGGGSVQGILNNCTIVSNYARFAGGSDGGILNNCIIINNTATEYGGGCGGPTINYGPILNNCTLKGNFAKLGGGTYRATLNNCIISGNHATNHGGGSYQSKLYNCTITGNTAAKGGGSYEDTLYNSIIYHNEAITGSDNYYEGTFTNCCTTPLPTGFGNITNDPMLISVSRIATNSPCVGAGTNNYVSGSDIDGDSWASPPAIGCDEPYGSATGSLDVSIMMENTTISPGYDLLLAANITGEISSNKWSFGDSTFAYNSGYVKHAWVTTGVYDVVLTAYNDDNPGGVAATLTVFVVHSTFYVDINNTNSVYPYTNWSTAATNIQDSIDAAVLIPGSLVLVSNGTYSTGSTVTPGYKSLNRIVITKGITVKSVNGSEVTIIEGQWSGPIVDTYYLSTRGAFISSGILSGFTVSQGWGMDHRLTGDEFYDKAGAGINMYGGNGVATNCIIANNIYSRYGGGSCGGILNNCIISNNDANEGGGSYYGILNNCYLKDNTSSSKGGGSYDSILNNCILTENYAGAEGGGSSYGILNNCLLYGNSSSNDGGGSDGGVLNNCILYGNTAGWSGGGSAAGTLNNCIVYNNDPNNWVHYSVDYNYCCTIPSTGIGCVTNNPQFVDPINGNFKLKPTSPCIDSGLNSDWMIGSTDFSGNKRIMGGAVDIGAYELGFTANLKVILEGAYENE